MCTVARGKVDASHRTNDAKSCQKPANPRLRPGRRDRALRTRIGFDGERPVFRTLIVGPSSARLLGKIGLSFVAAGPWGCGGRTPTTPDEGGFARISLSSAFGPFGV